MFDETSKSLISTHIEGDIQWVRGINGGLSHLFGLTLEILSTYAQRARIYDDCIQK